MGLVKWIVAGMGWEIGKEAAREGMDALRPKPPQTPEEKKRAEKAAKEAAKARARDEKRAAKLAAKAERERHKEKLRDEKTIDRELEALKKQMRD